MGFDVTKLLTYKILPICVSLKACWPHPVWPRVYRISGRLDNLASDPLFFDNPAPAGFFSEIWLAAGFSRILIGIKQNF